MVTFVTLILSLISGTLPVEVAVDGPVTRVELVLDGRLVGTRNGPPWRFLCDFGNDLVPHELVAVAYDADGNEMHSTRQLINLPRPQAETRIAFESDESGTPNAVRVFWESADPVKPLSVYAIFDGFVLQPDDDNRFELPPYDPGEIHIVTAEVQFLGDVTARTDVTFGGRYGSQVATELTAVPIQMRGGRPTVDDLQGRFLLDGKPLAVAAVEQPGIKVFLIRDLVALHQLEVIRRHQDAVDGGYPGGGSPSRQDRLTREDDQLYFVLPNPKKRRNRELFPTTSGWNLKRWDLKWLVTHALTGEGSVRGQQLADAVAVAGVQAASEGAPRAVVLVTSGRPSDKSIYEPAKVRRFLRSLRVPLYVWSTSAGDDLGWGPDVLLDNAKTLRRAAKALMREAGQQWIVWLEGSHMVNQIELAKGGSSFWLAGDPPS
jgi:hypothetical protein